MGTLHELPELSQRETGGSDVAFAFILFLLWAFSVVRVSAAISAREVFGAEASLAFVCMLGLPWWAVRTVLRRRARRAPSRQRRPGEVVAFRRRR